MRYAVRIELDAEYQGTTHPFDTKEEAEAWIRCRKMRLTGYYLDLTDFQIIEVE
jgi:hypothetical protein